MRKLALMLVAVLAFCGVAMADWAADYAAWKGLKPDVAKYGEDFTAGIALAQAAPLADVARMTADARTIVIEGTGDMMVRLRWVAVLMESYKRQMTDAIRSKNQEAALKVWGEMLTLCDEYYLTGMTESAASLINYASAPTINTVLSQGKILVHFKYITEEDLVLALKDRMPLMSIEQQIAQYDTFPAGLRLSAADVVKYVQENGGQIVVSGSRSLEFLAKCYSRGEISAADYDSVMKSVLISGITSMNSLPANDPRRAQAMTTLTTAKTITLQLQAVEKSLEVTPQ